MIRLHHSPQDREVPSSLELPTRLLKQVLIGHGLRLGERVLVAGCGHGELTAFLDGLGYDVEAIDDSIERIEDARRLFPRFDFQFARLDESIPVPKNEFDLILVQDLDVYRENLLDSKSRSATANLLSCLKPRGELVIVRHRNTRMDLDSGHNAGCWKRHLACFPGQLETTEFRESFFENSRWDWLFGKRDHSDYFTVTLQTPAEKLNSENWHDFVRRDLMPGQDTCCRELFQEVRRAA